LVVVVLHAQATLQSGMGGVRQVVEEDRGVIGSHCDAPPLSLTTTQNTIRHGLPGDANAETVSHISQRWQRLGRIVRRGQRLPFGISQREDRHRLEPTQDRNLLAVGVLNENDDRRQNLDSLGAPRPTSHLHKVGAQERRRSWPNPIESGVR